MKHLLPVGVQKYLFTVHTLTLSPSPNFLSNSISSKKTSGLWIPGGGGGGCNLGGVNQSKIGLRPSTSCCEPGGSFYCQLNTLGSTGSNLWFSGLVSDRPITSHPLFFRKK
jgi:hypothetical protein